MNYSKAEIIKGRDYDFTYRIVHQDGSKRWIRDVVSVVTNSGIPEKLVGFMQDITKQKNTEMEKQAFAAQLRQAQKMEAIGTLAGGIAHDFNNILSVIFGYAEMAMEDSSGETKYQQDLDQVINAASRAKELVGQILTFSRQSQIKRVPIKIQPVIKEGLKMLRSSIPATISIMEDIEPETGNILADPTQVHQILKRYRNFPQARFSPFHPEILFLK